MQRLEEGEEWLLEPRIDMNNPHLMSPGIKWDVKPGSFTQSTELFGPLLAVIPAKDLPTAIKIANSTAYGLTAGLHSLDPREQLIWLKEIQAGNCYINRGITGAIVERQPFGGTKASSFGPGAKAGGPNYVLQLMEFKQKILPEERASLPQLAQELFESSKQITDFELLEKSVRNYSFFWKHFFSHDHDPMHLLGQDNLQRYVPHQHVHLRLHPDDSALDMLRVALATRITQTPLTISSPIPIATYGLKIDVESDQEFIQHLPKSARVRLLRMPNNYIVEALSHLGLWINPRPVMASGRIELLHYLREVSISYDYHRYGNLGERELPTKE
jgi:RHH-type proline utilization regulon transcriptional repressor/proline dehydrogenase/delta 1-pyrroline-5-carboxylate dehydrogenase